MKKFSPLFKSLFIVIFFIPLGLFVWKYEINKLEINQRKDVSDIIRSTVRQQAKKGILLPQIIFINTNSSQKNQLKDTLISQISNSLIEKYLKEDTISFEKLDIQSFYILPNKPNKNGDYTVTEEQIKELQNHIDFLTKQVDIEVEKVKEEVGKDIDRLNTWVSIWIGVIGFLGIFIPIVINFDVSKKASDAIEKSEEAKANSAEALKVINDNKENINKISGLNEEVETLKGSIAGIEEKAKKAEGEASSAITIAENSLKDSTKTKYAISVVFAINNLHTLDPETLIQIPGKENKINTLINTLELLHTELSNCSEDYDSKLIKNCLKQLSIRIQNISYYRFINVEKTKLLNQFAELVSSSLDDYTRQKFDNIVTELSTLITNLNNDSDLSKKTKENA